MLISFDLINHQFYAVDIPNELKGELPNPFHISNLGNSLVIFGNLILYEIQYICAWLLQVDGASVTSWRLLFIILSPNVAKLIRCMYLIGWSFVVSRVSNTKSEDVGEDKYFKSGSWVSATDYVNANGGTVTVCLGDIKNFLKNGKLDEVVAIVKYCSPNVIGDLTMTTKDLFGIIPETIQYKVIDEGGYGKDITVGAALILANVLVLSLKPSMHYLNITMRNVVKVFCKDTATGSGSDANIGLFTKSDGNRNDAKVLKEVVLPSDEPVAMEVQSPLVDQTNAVKSGRESYPPLPTQGTTSSGNTHVVPVESIRAVSDRNTWGKFGLVRSMFSSSTRLFSFQFSSQDGLNAMLENGLWFIRNHPIILEKWNPDVNLLKEDVGSVPVWVKLHGVPERSSYARAMIELWADVELKDTIVVVMPKINRKGLYTCKVHVEYEWKPPRCSCCKIFGHTQVECPKNPGLGAGAGETKNPKKTSQAPKGFQVGLKMAFKPNQEYRPVTKKHISNSSGNMKKGVDSTSNVRDSNTFEVLNSVDNDVKMGTNRGTSNLDKNGANLSRSLFRNVKNSSTSTSPVMDKIRKLEILVIDGQLVDEAGNPLKKVEYSGDHDSDDEVASVDNDIARDLASERTGFGAQSLLEQWRDSYGNGDYDDDPCDDDIYEGQDLSKEIQTICDKLDIRVRGRKKQ
uniref:Uncharacterized protein n=1 Tax=Tanacetum cinerariifolium TaxID=118510 RepID=A0A6L2KKV1_TANCI|nr:hypothetical protein [Tanacetum cinerariifolium]